MQQDMTEQEKIDAAQRIEGIVKDEVFQSVVAKFVSENFRDFKQAKEASEILALHARSVAMDTFLNELQIVIDNGQAAKIQRKSREEREERERQVIAARKKTS